MNARILLLLGLVVPAAMLLPACGQPAAGQPEPVISDWPNEGKLSEWAAAVAHEGQQNHPDVYAGVEINVVANTVIVRRIPSATFDEAVRGLLPPAATVRYIDATYSERQLTGWAATVVADTDYWRKHGIELNLVAAKPGLCVEVGIDDPARDTAAITARYPGRPICVEHAGKAVPLTTGVQK
jgi:hypothetical protein